MSKTTKKPTTRRNKAVSLPTLADLLPKDGPPPQTKADESGLQAWAISYENARQGRRLDRPARQRKGRNRLDRTIHVKW